MRTVVVSLYDHSTLAVQPWADAGYDCFCYDIKHKTEREVISFGAGTITKVHCDLFQDESLLAIQQEHAGKVAFLIAFPVCTHLSLAGACHFDSKRESDNEFQVVAAKNAIVCEELAKNFGCPYVVENPKSMLTVLWRNFDYKFQPWQYGGYIPIEQGDHPLWPQYILPFDAYKKETCFWTGNGFVMPPPLPVPFTDMEYAPQFAKLGGTSEKTKEIRSCSPRGIFIAIHQYNGKMTLRK